MKNLRTYAASASSGPRPREWLKIRSNAREQRPGERPTKPSGHDSKERRPEDAHHHTSIQIFMWNPHLRAGPSGSIRKRRGRRDEERGHKTSGSVRSRPAARPRCPTCTTDIRPTACSKTTIHASARFLPAMLDAAGATTFGHQR